MKEIAEWLTARNKLKYYKQKESTLRKKICSEILAGKAEGGVTKHKPEGKITATAKINRTLDTAVLDALWEDLAPLDKEAVFYKPTIVMKQYKILGEDSLLHKAVIAKPGMPSLSIKEVQDGN